MSNALVTIAAPIAVEKIAAATALIEGLGNPARSDIAALLAELTDDDGVHFASLHAIPPTDPQSPRGHLVLELSADGDAKTAIARLARQIGKQLEPIFALAEDRRHEGIDAYLQAHIVQLGQGWTNQAGLAFAGTPDMAVGRVRREADLALFIAAQVGKQSRGLSALQRLEDIRGAVRKNAPSAWALNTPAAALPTAPDIAKPALIWALYLSFVKTYLWPLAIPLLLVLAYGLTQVIPAFGDVAARDAGLALKAWLVVKLLWSSLLWLLAVACVFIVAVLLVLGALYASLRGKEMTDPVDERILGRDVLRKILANENHYAQNHMVSITRLKPGITRAVTVRLAFWLIGALAGLSFKTGFLGDIGTIHFARWVTLPGSRDLVFFSNFGGSWESYLEDFITKAHAGLTAVWSNSIGFPRTENLFQKGATDGERFKRYARHSMLPTPFWYSAYPTLTTANIRTNAAIRRGLAVARTDEEAIAWLALFGSATRPAAKLESDQIQSIVFGGLGFMPHGQLLLIDLGQSQPEARAWLKELRGEIAFDDGRRLKRPAAVTLALAPRAFSKLGLPADALETFPAAYLDGMTGPGRARILGDDPSEAWWWRAGESYDAAILVYGEDESSAATLANKVTSAAALYGHALLQTLPLHEIPDSKPDRKEPFGFVDGTSQPVIRGTYRGLRNADPIHLVEPGEFILGYPDNRGNIPPGPSMRAADDPHNALPIRCDNTAGFNGNAVSLGREIGRNGSFLVIRQLEQDHDAFWNYCDQEAARLHDRLGEPYEITKEFIAAKMVGRWPDGSSLARNPYRPFSEDERQHVTRRAETNPANQAIIVAPAGPPQEVSQAVTKVMQPSAMNAAEPEAAAAVKPKTYRGNPEDNDFLFGTEDPQGLRCPFGAHIRRANPRDSLDPGSQDQIDISNRHRILRVGRSYIPGAGQNKGLMFMCLNGDIERQFEFVQQTWLDSTTFHGLEGERDPLGGNKLGCASGFTIPTRDGPVRLAPMARFVKPRGGGYFFLPGKKLLEFLSD